jgi:chromosome segregation protein
MPFIKKIVMHGFKSFVKKTEILFTPGINVILGPNGSGKSNISDALCFVLGRLSIKSMRAAKARNLIFMGTKIAAPAKEASVEIIFDNSDKTFSIDHKEISIKRIVRKKSQSVYKINNETKTRQEVLALLAQAGIDPNGFNIILQGEIQNFVRMQSEERRKIVEEVSGIAIYELRKEKSLKELSRTEDRLKEVLTILRERTIFLHNLEKERQQALRYKKLEKDIKKYKANIVYYDLTKKKKEKAIIDGEILKKKKEIEKSRKVGLTFQLTIENIESKIVSMNSTIQKSTGLEQEKLNQEIADMRANLAGINVRIENYENKLLSIEKQKNEFNRTLSENKLEIKKLGEESPTKSKTQKEREEKKKELEKLEEKRKKFYTTKSELKSIRERIRDKESLLQNFSNESEFLLKQIKSFFKDLFDSKTKQEKVDALKLSLAEKKELLERLNKREIELEKISGTNEYEIDEQKKLMNKLSKMDMCPLCKNKITKLHMEEIYKEISPKIESLKKEIENSDKELGEIYSKRDMIKQEIEQTIFEISKRESDLIKISNINEKKNQIKILQAKIDELKKELFELSKKEKNLGRNFDIDFNIEQKYETLRIEIQELSSRTEENINSEISFKQREFERAKISLNQAIREEEDFKKELQELKIQRNEKEKFLQKKKQIEQELIQKFQKLIVKRDALQKEIRENELKLSSNKNITYNFEKDVNNSKIDVARVDAEVENLEIEMLNFPNIEIVKTNKEILLQKLNKSQEIISRIGSVNLRSLEVYEHIKKEYDSVKEKAAIIEKEKEGVLKIIHQVDIKKKKEFLKTLISLNEIFSRNFSQLSEKGHVYLEMENTKDPFAAGINITVKTGHGKYLDVKSLSGGEQTLVALSLIFAIQELSPYYFYILDEIDAALDKRNSARLAGLLEKYMQKGQYIVISHNDEIISNATNLYGVSMHDGISKVVSLKV